MFHQLPVLKTSTCSSGRLVPWAKVSSPAPPVGIASPFIKYYRAARPAASASGSGPTGAPSRGLRRPENPQDRRPRDEPRRADVDAIGAEDPVSPQL